MDKIKMKAENREATRNAAKMNDIEQSNGKGSII